MIQNYIENANFEDTGFAYTLSLISGKHKMVILYCLMEFNPPDCYPWGSWQDGSCRSIALEPSLPGTETAS